MVNGISKITILYSSMHSIEEPDYNGQVRPVISVHNKKVITLQELNRCTSSIGKSTFGTLKLVHYSEVISIVSFIGPIGLVITHS